MTNSETPAYPTTRMEKVDVWRPRLDPGTDKVIEQVKRTEVQEVSYPGLTKREYFAARIAAGYINAAFSNGKTFNAIKKTAEEMHKEPINVMVSAVMQFTDALLAALEPK